MPYLLVSTQIRMEVGPTMVGDEHSDPSLMRYLGATKRNMLGNHFWEYYVDDAPRIVLDKLERAVLEVHAKWELRICLLPDLGGQGWEVKHRWHTASSPKRKQELLISHCALREPLHSAARPISIPYWIMAISIRLSVRRVPFKHNMVVPEIP
uniref:GTP cyclohydrolase 1 feedback regulatory protein n=1 Tax=Anas platyrhynchos platyrhynchos TaxID=8840 RepID=A0A493T914_ANAPP